MNRYEKLEVLRKLTKLAAVPASARVAQQGPALQDTQGMPGGTQGPIAQSTQVLPNKNANMMGLRLIAPPPMKNGAAAVARKGIAPKAPKSPRAPKDLGTGLSKQVLASVSNGLEKRANPLKTLGQGLKVVGPYIDDAMGAIKMIKTPKPIPKVPSKMVPKGTPNRLGEAQKVKSVVQGSQDAALKSAPRAPVQYLDDAGASLPGAKPLGPKDSKPFLQSPAGTSPATYSRPAGEPLTQSVRPHVERNLLGSTYQGFKEGLFGGANPFKIRTDRAVKASKDADDLYRFGTNKGKIDTKLKTRTVKKGPKAGQTESYTKTTLPGRRAEAAVPNMTPRLRAKNNPVPTMRNMPDHYKTTTYVDPKLNKTPKTFLPGSSPGKDGAKALNDAGLQRKITMIQNPQWARQMTGSNTSETKAALNEMADILGKSYQRGQSNIAMNNLFQGVGRATGQVARAPAVAGIGGAGVAGVMHGLNAPVDTDVVRPMAQGAYQYSGLGPLMDATGAGRALDNLFFSGDRKFGDFRFSKRDGQGMNEAVAEQSARAGMEPLLLDQNVSKDPDNPIIIPSRYAGLVPKAGTSETLRKAMPGNFDSQQLDAVTDPETGKIDWNKINAGADDVSKAYPNQPVTKIVGSPDPETGVARTVTAVPKNVTLENDKDLNFLSAEQKAKREQQYQVFRAKQKARALARKKLRDARAREAGAGSSQDKALGVKPEKVK